MASKETKSGRRRFLTAGIAALAGTAGVRRRHLSLRLLRYGAVRLQDEIRVGHRMAELLAIHLTVQYREEFRFQFCDAARCYFLPAL